MIEIKINNSFIILLNEICNISLLYLIVYNQFTYLYNTFETFLINFDIGIVYLHDASS